MSSLCVRTRVFLREGEPLNRDISAYRLAKLKRLRALRAARENKELEEMEGGEVDATCQGPCAAIQPPPHVSPPCMTHPHTHCEHQSIVQRNNNMSLTLLDEKADLGYIDSDSEDSDSDGDEGEGTTENTALMQDTSRV